MNEKLAAVTVVALAGLAVIEVSGAVASGGGGGGFSGLDGGDCDFTVQVKLAGEASVLLEPSVARTENWWEPTPSPE